MTVVERPKMLLLTSIMPPRCLDTNFWKPLLLRLSFPLEDLRKVVTKVLMASSISKGGRKIKKAEALNAQAANRRYWRVFATHASHWVPNTASFINRKTCVYVPLGGTIIIMNNNDTLTTCIYNIEIIK